MFCATIMTAGVLNILYSLKFSSNLLYMILNLVRKVKWSCYCRSLRSGRSDKKVVHKRHGMIPVIRTCGANLAAYRFLVWPSCMKGNNSPFYLGSPKQCEGRLSVAQPITENAIQPPKSLGLRCDDHHPWFSFLCSLWYAIRFDPSPHKCLMRTPQYARPLAPTCLNIPFTWPF